MKQFIAAILLATVLCVPGVSVVHADIGPCNGCHAVLVR